jgi:hypothetical protein
MAASTAGWSTPGWGFLSSARAGRGSERVRERVRTSVVWMEGKEGRGEWEKGRRGEDGGGVDGSMRV